MLFFSPNAKYFYGLCILGWAIGLILARGRVRVFVATGVAAFGYYLLYMMAFILLDVIWWLPIPFDIEHSLAYLFIASAVAGYWSGLQSIAAFASSSAGREPLGGALVSRLTWGVWASFLAVWI